MKNEKLSFEQLISEHHIIANKSDADIQRILAANDWFRIIDVRLGDIFVSCRMPEYGDRNFWITIPEHPNYQFLVGNEELYKTWIEYKTRNSGNPNSHSIEKYRALIASLDKNGYDSKRVIFVNNRLQVHAGAHRAAWLYNKYGPEFMLSAVQIIPKQKNAGK